MKSSNRICGSSVGVVVVIVAAAAPPAAAIFPFVLASTNIKPYLSLYDLIALNHTEDCEENLFIVLYTYFIHKYNDIAEKRATAAATTTRNSIESIFCIFARI